MFGDRTESLQFKFHHFPNGNGCNRCHVWKMVYGMLTSQSCHLSKILRVLKKTIDHLFHNLSAFYADERFLED